MSSGKLNTHKMWDCNQSPWLDDISKCMLDSGELEKLVYQEGIRGVTTNPSIFEKAISSGECGYPEGIRNLLAEGKDAIEVYEALTSSDVIRAADTMRRLYDESGGVDGFVSWEEAPEWADDEEMTVTEARRLSGIINRPNLFVKVPSTPAGIAALRRLIREGISINMTLIFSREQYINVAEAYIAGLEDRLADDNPLENVSSVASVFISRVDTEVDNALDALKTPEADELKGKIGVANTKMVYQDYLRLFKHERFEKLANLGAKVQRPLWASTGTKNPAYSDTLYVTELIAPETVNTIPAKTVAALQDHGVVVAETALANLDEAKSQLKKLDKLGVSLDDINTNLLQAGLKSFGKSYDDLITTIKKSAEVVHD
jgi:transaldolase / glucose-6-phosphate isomerase